MKKRIKSWVICLIIATAYIAVDQYKKNLPVEEEVEIKKDTLYLYSDVASENIINKKFDNMSLSSKYELKLVDEADDTNQVLTKKLSMFSDDDEISSISYTPLIIGMKNSKSLQKYQESGLLISTKKINNSIDDEISIDLKKLIDAVVNGDNWSIFGGDEKEFRIYVPKRDSIEGKIFYNLILVTINNGSYPTNEEALVEAKEVADNFWNSSNCIEIEDTISELKKIGSINITDIYILFESDFINSDIWSQAKLDICIAYPSTTIVRHMYALVDDPEFNDFYYELSTELNYRTSTKFLLKGDKNYNIKEDITFVEASSYEDEEEDYIPTWLIIMVAIIVAIVVISFVAGIIMA